MVSHTIVDELDCALAEMIDDAMNDRWDRYDHTVKMRIYANEVPPASISIILTVTSSVWESIYRICKGKNVALYDIPLDNVIQEDLVNGGVNPDMLIGLVPPTDMKHAVDVIVNIRWPDASATSLQIRMQPLHVSRITPILEGMYPYPILTYRNRYRCGGIIMTTDAPPNVRMLCANFDSTIRRQLALIGSIASPVMELPTVLGWETSKALTLPDLQEAMLVEGRVYRAKKFHESIFCELMEAMWAPRRVFLGLIDPFADDDE